MEKIRYDFAFSLGAACAASIGLRRANLQFASFPFDWLASGDVAENFCGWLRMEDLELTDVLHTTFNASIYRNRRTGLTFPHDFPVGCYREGEFPGVAAKYDRRVRRLYFEVEKAKRIQAVYNEVPCRSVAGEADVLKAQRLLQERFPGKRIDLLYFAQDPECRDREPRILNENVTMVLLDYQAGEQGHVGFAALYHKLIKYLHGRYEVSDMRTPEQVADAQAAAGERERRRRGKGSRRRGNMRAYHLYRHLERFLFRRGCIPNSERPMKVHADRGERRRSLKEPDISFLTRDGAAAQHAYDLR